MSRSSEKMGSVEAERWCFRFLSWTRTGAGAAEVEPDPDAVWLGLGFDGALRSDAGTSMWAKSIRQTKFADNKQTLTIFDMDNLVDESLICQLG
jgi:hypothetical protein